MRAVSIILHTKKEAPARILPGLIAWLKDRDITAKLPILEAAELGFSELGHPEESLFDGSDFVIVMGGDGTVLRVARLLQKKTLPVFGLNLGKIGFLMRFEEDRLYWDLERVLAGNFSIEQRTMLQVDITYQDGGRMERLGLNEALISGEEFNRLIELDVSINDKLFSRFALDGMIVATPTGATAYSFSAGGPFVSPQTELLLLTPICPHSLFNRTMVLSATDKVTIAPANREKIDKIRISMDGAAVGTAISKVEVSLAPEKFKFIVSDGPDFFASLRLKLHGWDYFAKD